MNAKPHVLQNGVIIVGAGSAGPAAALIVFRRMGRGEGLRGHRAAERGYKFPPSDADCHMPRPQWDYARCKIATVSPPNRQFCDVLYSLINRACRCRSVKRPAPRQNPVFHASG